MADLLREKCRARGTHRAQLGGGGGRTASTTETNTQDSRITQQSGTAVSGNNNTVLDGNAINRAFDFGGAAFEKALTFSAATSSRALDSLNTTSELVRGAYEDAKGRGAMTDYVILGGMALAGIIAVQALRK